MKAGFTSKTAKEIVSRHTAIGAYPIARAYGNETKITSFEFQKNLSTDDVTGTITWIGLDKNQYRVFYKKSSDPSWTRSYNLISAGSTDTVSEKTDVILNLSEDTEYHFMITGGTGSDSEFRGLITQHISDLATNLIGVSESPELAKVIKIKTPKVT